MWVVRIGAAGNQQAVTPRQFKVEGALLGRMGCVEHLDAVQPSRSERSDILVGGRDGVQTLGAARVLNATETNEGLEQ